MLRDFVDGNIFTVAAGTNQSLGKGTVRIVEFCGISRRYHIDIADVGCRRDETLQGTESGHNSHNAKEYDKYQK